MVNPFNIVPRDVINSLPVRIQDHVFHRHEDVIVLDATAIRYSLECTTIALEYFYNGERITIEWDESPDYSRLDSVTMHRTGHRLFPFNDSYVAAPRSSEEIAEQVEKRKKREEEKRKAQKRAEALFFASLTDEQREQVEKYSKFDVIGSKGGKYTIGYYEGSFNIKGAAADYCLTVKANSGIPYPDIILAQKLLIETNEPEFLRTANKDWYT